MRLSIEAVRQPTITPYMVPGWIRSALQLGLSDNIDQVAGQPQLNGIVSDLMQAFTIMQK